MLTDLLYNSPEWLLFLTFLALISIASEAGFRLGRIFGSSDPGAERETSMIVTSMVAVLGLLLGFSMSMAVSRFETRKLLVIQEANAVGTAYLRTQLLPEPVRTEVATALRDYLDARIRCGEADDDLAQLKATYEVATRLQTRFWDRAVTYSRTDPNPVTTGLLLQSLNESIDLAAARWGAFFNHVPNSVIVVDALIALLSSLLFGYQMSLEGSRQTFTAAVLALSIALIWITIIDMDRPTNGLIRIGQEPMLDLRSQMRNPFH